LRIAELRGNVPSRVGKLRDGHYDAIVVARAGLDRLALDLTGLEVVTLAPEVMQPAPAQGALALEVRSSDTELLASLALLDDPAVRRPVMAERELMALFDAGCQLALGAHATGGATGSIELTAWYQGRLVRVRHDEPLRAAQLAYSALFAVGGSEELGGAEPAMGRTAEVG